MKKCSHCKNTLLITEFNKKKIGKDNKLRYQTYCKICQHKLHKNWYVKNKNKVYKRNKINRKKVSKWLQNFKLNLSCNKCGESGIWCLDFHHRNPNKKKFNVCSRSTYQHGKQKIIKEIEKCDVLCSNCHRKHHWEERNKTLQLT